MSAEKEDLEQRIFQRYAEIRKQKPAKVRIDDIREALPENGCIVDLFSYRKVSWGPNGTGDRNATACLVAFVVPRVGEIIRVELGEAKLINDAVAKWREGFGLAISGQSTDAVNAPAADEILKTLVWDPIAKHLPEDGAVIIAPDGALALFPFCGAAWQGQRILFD